MLQLNKAAAADTDVRGEVVRVLLAEDDAVNRDLAHDLLCSAGLHVDLAGDGLEAVRMAAARGYDLILVDMEMPHMDGLTAARAIRAGGPNRAVPILATSSSAGPERQAACRAAGMNELLAKPFSADQLYAAIRRLPQLHLELPARAGADGAPPPATDARLAGIPGLAPDNLLELLHGRVERYLDVLYAFAAAHGDDTAQIAAAIAAGRPQQAHAVAHALKGALAALGLPRAADAAAAMEHALPGPGALPPAELLNALEVELAPVLAAIAALHAVSQTAAPTPAALAAADLAPLLIELAAGLRGGDYAAYELWNRHAAGLRASLGEYGAHLENQIKRFDYEAALATLQAARVAGA
ncbi:MAG: response regulator [Rhodocyclaceae bacterium]|nr:response regulator [Rhodocyclaceae bacterium]MBX3670152.1 response regulator [Rhodocyclaceae bacterium]